MSYISKSEIGTFEDVAAFTYATNKLSFNRFGYTC